MSCTEVVPPIHTVVVPHPYRVRLLGGPDDGLCIDDVRQHAELGGRWVPSSRHAEGYYVTDDTQPWSDGERAVARWVPDERDRFIYMHT